jgi:hypothetical protein
MTSSSSSSTLKGVASDTAELATAELDMVLLTMLADAKKVSVLNKEQQEHFDEAIGGIVDVMYDNYETCHMFDDCEKTADAKALFKAYKKSMKRDIKYAIEVAVKEKKDTACGEDMNRDMVCDAVSNSFIDLFNLDLFENVNKTFLTAEILRVIGDDLTIELVEKMTIALSDFEEAK